MNTLVQLSRKSKFDYAFHDSFKLKPRNWLEKFCIDILKRKKAITKAFETVETVSYTNFKSKDLTIAILSALNDMWNEHYKAREIVMGEKEFCEFTGNKNVQEWFVFDFEGRDHRGKFLGIPVRVLPWITGWAVV